MREKNLLNNDNVIFYSFLRPYAGAGLRNIFIFLTFLLGNKSNVL